MHWKRMTNNRNQSANNFTTHSIKLREWNHRSPGDSAIHANRHFPDTQRIVAQTRCLASHSPRHQFTGVHVPCPLFGCFAIQSLRLAYRSFRSFAPHERPLDRSWIKIPTNTANRTACTIRPISSPIGHKKTQANAFSNMTCDKRKTIEPLTVMNESFGTSNDQGWGQVHPNRED